MQILELFRHPRSIVLDVSRLKEDERIEFKYDQNKTLIAIQKVKLSLFQQPIRAIAETEILPADFGRVFFQGSSWKAQSESEFAISKGQSVLVTSQHGITLIVNPCYG